MDDMPWILEKRRKIGGPANNLRKRDKTREGIDAVDAVLKGHDASVRPDQGKNGLRGLVAVIDLDRENHDIDRPNFGRSVGSGEARQIDIAESTRHPQAAASHHVEMSAAGNESDILTGLGEARAYIAAYAA